MTGPPVFFVRASGNRKTGPIPVLYAARSTCPAACPLRGAGCYADGATVAPQWRKADAADPDSWRAALLQVRALPKGQLWRYGVAGDLPGTGNRIAAGALLALARASRGRRGFAFTHKPPTAANLAAIRAAMVYGFAVNLSANNLDDADRLAATGLPVAVVLPRDAPRKLRTPEGRTVQMCPASAGTLPDCASCGACASLTRRAIIGFPVHGQSWRRAAQATGNDR